jgi:hypothetical protein
MESTLDNNHSGMKKRDDEKEEQDWYDNVCETTTNLFCPVPEKPPELLSALEAKDDAMLDHKFESVADEDMLDHVFESVETFTCREQQEPEKVDPGGNDETSLVATSQTNENGKAQNQASSPRIAPLGEEGDALDYLFEKVESLVCAPSYDDPEQLLVNTVPVLERENSIVARGDEELHSIIYVPEEESRGVSADVELDAETKKELWYKEPKYMILGVFLLLIIVGLVVFGLLFLTKW